MTMILSGIRATQGRIGNLPLLSVLQTNLPHDARPQSERGILSNDVIDSHRPRQSQFNSCHTVLVLVNLRYFPFISATAL